MEHTRLSSCRIRSSLYRHGHHEWTVARLKWSPLCLLRHTVLGSTPSLQLSEASLWTSILPDICNVSDGAVHDYRFFAIRVDPFLRALFWAAVWISTLPTNARGLDKLKHRQSIQDIWGGFFRFSSTFRNDSLITL